jgi:hypothetical protein
VPSPPTRPRCLAGVYQEGTSPQGALATTNGSGVAFACWARRSRWWGGQRSRPSRCHGVSLRRRLAETLTLLSSQEQGKGARQHAAPAPGTQRINTFDRNFSSPFSLLPRLVMHFSVGFGRTAPYATFAFKIATVRGP